MKRVLIYLMGLGVALQATANVEPVVTIVSAQMRPGTTLMDVVYNVADADDATVKVRALAFVDGVRSFANVLRPETWAEGTEANLGDAIATGVDHTLTWNIGADWNIDLGQVNFEVLCRDSRGLLAFDWLTIPAAAGHPELTISEDYVLDADVLNAFFWQYSDFDPGITLTNGSVLGTSSAAEFDGVELITGTAVQIYGAPYICKVMDVDPSRYSEIRYANNAIRGGFNATQWHVVQRSYAGVNIAFAWGDNGEGQSAIPRGASDIISINAGNYHSLALLSDGSVVGWGFNDQNRATAPSSVTNAIATAVGFYHSLALMSDGAVVGWGYNGDGQATVPLGVTNVTAIAAGIGHSLALMSDGLVIGWGLNELGQTTVPTSVTNATAIAAGSDHSLALLNDGSVVSWGRSITMPSSVTNVISISAGEIHNLALLNDGSVVGWGNNSHGQITIPSNVTNVTAIAAGGYHSLALLSDGTVVGWGKNNRGQATVPSGVSNVTAIAAGYEYSLSLKEKP